VGKLLSLGLSGIVGLVLAGVAVAGVISSSTQAPKHNPASAQIIDYGNR
jgi:hypothetical protein